jgi:hypothetical protein
VVVNRRETSPTEEKSIITDCSFPCVKLRKNGGNYKMLKIPFDMFLKIPFDMCAWICCGIAR